MANPQKKPLKKNRSPKSGSILVEDSGASYTSRLRAIGNSQGVIINDRLLEAAGMSSGINVIVKAGKGIIYIIEMKTPVSTELSAWEKQFKAAHKKGVKP